MIHAALIILAIIAGIPLLALMVFAVWLIIDQMDGKNPFL